MSLNPDFGYVMLAASAIHIQYFMAGANIGSQRKKHGIKYPDMGNGRFSAKLNDKDWEEFNNYQRVHGNYLESLPSVYTFLLIGGYFHPKLQASLGALYVVGRYLYGRGYTSTGPSGRMVGAGFNFLTSLSMLGVTVYSALQLLGIF